MKKILIRYFNDLVRNVGQNKSPPANLRQKKTQRETTHTCFQGNLPALLPHNVLACAAAVETLWKIPFCDIAGCKNWRTPIFSLQNTSALFVHKVTLLKYCGYGAFCVLVNYVTAYCCYVIIFVPPQNGGVCTFSSWNLPCTKCRITA